MSNEYNFDDFIKVDKSEIRQSSVSRAGRGITISKDGLITFQAILAKDLGMSKGKSHSLTFGMRSNQTILAIRVTEGSDGDVTNAGKKKHNAIAARTELRHLIEKHGNQEVKSRWITMFDQKGDYAKKLEFNSYVFTEQHTDEDTGLTEAAVGLTRKGNDFFIDLMSGKGNNQDGDKKKGKKSNLNKFT